MTLLAPLGLAVWAGHAWGATPAPPQQKCDGGHPKHTGAPAPPV